MQNRPRISRSKRSDARLGPSRAELRAALVQARKRWRLAQESVRGHEGLYEDAVLGVEVRRDRHVESMLDIVRREEWIMGFTVKQLEKLVHGQPIQALPEGPHKRVDEAIRLLVSDVRRYRDLHGHLPEDGPSHRVQMRWVVHG